MKGKQQEEVGDLFVTEHSITVKLLPSKKSASKPINWFANGSVTNYGAAAKDISGLISRLKGKTRVVKRLTLMTDRGVNHDLTTTGLHEAISKAGFTTLG